MTRYKFVPIIISGIFLISAFFATSAKAQLPSIGIGISGGINYPILQADQGEGTIYSIRGILKIPLFVLQPHFSFGKYGDPDYTDLGVPAGLFEGAVAAPNGHGGDAAGRNVWRIGTWGRA